MLPDPGKVQAPAGTTPATLAFPPGQGLSQEGSHIYLPAAIPSAQLSKGGTGCTQVG